MRKISEIFVNGVCLEEILEKHRKWLNGEECGEKANLSYANLSYANLSYANLSGANLSYANLSSAYLRYADLSSANLSSAYLSSADLSSAYLRGADLSGANLNDANLNDAYLRDADLSGADLSSAYLSSAYLSGADLSDADLSGADLSSAYLRDADLSGADLSGADLSDADLKLANLNKALYDYKTSFFAMQCPEKGSFIGYKKADNKIVKLLITEDSKRSSATTRKCRCSKAKVLSITDIENTEEYNEVVSNFDNNFIYKVGEIVEVKDFDDDRWNECSNGIHFFITRDEAVMY